MACPTEILKLMWNKQEKLGTAYKITGGKDCEGVANTPADRATYKFGDISITPLYTPCHTQDSICWYLEDSTGKAVFTGDTLFHGGNLQY